MYVHGKDDNNDSQAGCPRYLFTMHAVKMFVIVPSQDTPNDFKQFDKQFVLTNN